MATQTATFLDPTELQDRLQASEGLLLLDVREPHEYAEWHIPGSVNVPLSRLPGTDVRALSEGRPVVTICLHGVRSERAREWLATLRMPAQTLRGGMVGWNRVVDIVELPPQVVSVPVRVFQCRRVGKGCLSYLLLAQRGEAIIIDPTMDVSSLVRYARERGATTVTLLETHAHADHVSGGLTAHAEHLRYATPDHEAARRIGAIPVHAGTTLVRWPGNLTVTAAPGHTPESVVYELGNLLFTGDTLFFDGVGRPDLGRDTRVAAGALWETLQDIVRGFPAGRMILPAHVSDIRAIRSGVPITAALGELRAELPPLALDRDAFVAWAVQSLPSPPANFVRIKEMNRALAPLVSPEELWDLEAGPNRCAV